MTSIIESCQGLPERRFAAGAIILEEGKKLGLIYILAEGSVEILKGDVQLNRVSTPGAIFGEMSVLLDQPHMATVKALTDSRFYEAENGKAFLRANPEINLHVSTLLAERLHAMSNYLIDLKNQFEDRKDHLGIVDEVLESLSHRQPKKRR
ncbi:MAG: cyclic nucleotide-binding domain-containing protein [Verrucomicrobiota bacterium]